MKIENLPLLFEAEESCNNSHPREAKFFKEPYSESDILELQNIFLNKGFHEIQVFNLDQGRKLINVFLQSLYYYHAPGCFTKQNLIPHKAIDIYEELQSKDAEIFFHERPLIDFLWIEMPKKNNEMPAFTKFIQTCEKLQLEKQMPVLALYFKC